MQSLKRTLFFFLVFASRFGLSATFIPLSFEQQVNESYGVIKGSYVGGAFKKLPTGEVITESVFKVSKFSGIKNHEIINKNNFKIIHPGGKWQGILYHVDGSPKFEEDQEIILLLSKTAHGFIPTNLALGKYQIFTKGGNDFIKSSIFPEHPKLGNISLGYASEIFSKYFGAPLTPVNHDKFVYKGETKSKSITTPDGRMIERKPAGLEESENPADSDPGPGLMWIVLLFSLLGFYSAYSMRPKRKK